MAGHGNLARSTGSLTPETIRVGQRVAVHYACADDDTGTVLGTDGQWAILDHDGHEGRLHSHVLISECDPLDEPDRELHVEVEYRHVFTDQLVSYRGPILKVVIQNKRGEEMHVLVIDPMTTITVRSHDYTVA